MTQSVLFFYGTLRAAEVRWAVLGYSLPSHRLVHAHLMNYQVRRVQGALYPMVVMAVGERVNGVVATGLDGASVARLDRFEGAHYSRSVVDVETATGQLAAELYFPDAAMIPAELWDFDSWYKHDMTAFLQQDFSCDGVRPPSS